MKVEKLCSEGKPTASAISIGEVTTLQHEVLDNPMERRALVALPLGLQGELTEVLGSLRHGAPEQTNLNALSGRAPYADVKEDLREIIRVMNLDNQG